MTLTNLVDSTGAELLRLRKWPAVWVTVGAWLALGLMFGYLLGYAAYATGDLNFASDGETRAELLAELLPAAIPDILVQGMPMFGAALAMVLGAVVAGNGFGWGSWKTVFTQGPSRVSVVVGSMLALTAIVVAAVLTTLLLFTGVSVGIAVLESQPVVWPGAGRLVESVLGGGLVIEMWALLGYALGTLARGPALSVGLGLVWVLVVENLLRGVGALLGPVEQLTHALPGTAAGSLVGALIDVDANPNQTPGVLSVLPGDQALLVVAAYAVGVTLLVLAVVRRRDVA
jgi:ABC-2 type transport system permease protein